MEIETIINTTADEADDFLVGVKSPSEARSLIKEHLAEHHPELEPDEVQEVTAGLLELLQREGFFENGAGSDEAWSEEDAREL